jgi:pimeloyl-ACP methyl ester carboxylesterase
VHYTSLQMKPFRFAGVTLRAFITVCIAMMAATLACGQRRVTFPPVSASATNGAEVQTVQGDLYGSGTRGLVLAHGGRFDEKSWQKQAEQFAQSGFLVLAVRFRGDGLSPDGTPSANGSYPNNAADVLAAAAYLKRIGAKTVDAIGGSLGGDAVGDADVMGGPGTFTHMVFLGSQGGDNPEKLTGRKLFIVAREDRSGDGLRLPGIEAHYQRAPEPKKLVILDGATHAQYLFGTDEGPQLMRELLEFLKN